MQRNILITLSLALLAHGAAVQAQTWNPKPGWKDSYAVGGRCYCDSNGYDHNLDTKTASTPVGVKNVVTICEDIQRVLGSGPTSGRIPYNDIQCGNGPANDAPDEAGCPGRVDIGSAGCNMLGPKWDLAAVYGTSPPPPPPPVNGALPRTGWKLSASSDANNLAKAIDGDPLSRWATRTPQAAGQFFQVDMGKLNSFDRILLDPANNPDDYPRSYQVLVSKDGSTWTGPVAIGALCAHRTIGQRYQKLVVYW
jgi:F5/8 type C domain